MATQRPIDPLLPVPSQAEYGAMSTFQRQLYRRLFELFLDIYRKLFGADPNFSFPVPSSMPRAIFDHFADSATSGTGVVNLYSDTIAANQLANNGDKLRAYYGGLTSVTNTGTREWFVTFAGTQILDSRAIGTSQSWHWKISVDIVRDSSSSVRCIAVWEAAKSDGNQVAQPVVKETKITGLTLTNTQALVLQGQASVAGNDITATQGLVEFYPHA